MIPIALRGWSRLSPSERPRAGFMFALLCLFSVGASWGFLSLNALILTQTPSEWWGDAIIAMGLSTIGISFAMSRVIERYSARDFLARLTSVFAAAALIGIVLLWFGQRAVASMGLFILSETITAIWINLWRALLLTGYDLRVARRILPLMSVAHLLSSFIGGTTYLFFISILQARAEQIAVLWAGVLVIVAIFLYGMPRWIPESANPPPTIDEEHLQASFRDGMRYIVQSPYMRWVAITIFIMSCLSALFYVISSHAATHYSLVSLQSPDLERSLGQLFAWAEVLGALVLLPLQFFIFPYMLQRFGVGGLNLVHAAVGVVLVGLLLPIMTGEAAPFVLIFVAGMLHLYRTLFRRVFRSPINSLLYHAIPIPFKGRVRALISSLIGPFGLVFAGIAAQMTNGYVLLMVVFVLAGCYLMACLIVRRRYTEAMLQLVDREDYSALLVETTETGLVDHQTLRLLYQRLQDAADPITQYFLIDVLAQTGGPDAVPLLLDYAHGMMPDIRLKVMQAVIQSEALTATARAFFVGYIDDSDPELRRTALIGMLRTAAADPPAAVHLALDYLHDPNAAIRSQMVRVVLSYGDAHQKDRARQVLTAMLYDNAFPEHRLEAVRALVAVDDTAYLPLLLDALWDSDDTVRLTTLQGLNRLWRNGIPEAVMAKLREYESLLLDDRVEQVREAELLLLRRLNNEVASRVLIQALGDHSPVIRTTAIQSLRDFDPSIEPQLLHAIDHAPKRIARFAAAVLGLRDRQKYHDIVIQEIQSIITMVHGHHGRIIAMSKCVGYSAFILLIGYSEEQSRQLLEDVFYLLSILHGDQALDVLAGLQSQDRRIHMQAQEALEAFAGARIANRLTPIYDTNPTASSRMVSIPPLHQVMQELATYGDIWLRAFTVFALGQMGARNSQVRQQLLGEIVPQTTPLNACQKALDPALISGLLRGALSSPEAEIRVAAAAAVRMIQDQDIREALFSEAETTMLATIERMIYLKRVSLFQNFTIEQLRALAGICDEQVFKGDSILFRQNDAGGILFVVVSGRVEVGLRGEDTVFMRLATYGPASAFGEMSLFDHSLRSAEAIAVEDTLTLTIRRDPFLVLMRRFPDVSVELMSVLSQRLRDANLRLSQFRTASSQQLPDI